MANHAGPVTVKTVQPNHTWPAYEPNSLNMEAVVWRRSQM